MGSESDELWYLSMPHGRIVDLICILEGHEGLAVPRVLDKERGIVELLTAPDLQQELQAMLDDLKKDFPIERVPRPEGITTIADD